jgi:DNA-directed RNA polymerase specialized sigma24 family protein
VRRKVVEDALATLRPQARAALILRHYYGYDYAQIGTFLGTGSGTVGSTLSRAHALLRQRLEGDVTAAERSTGSPARASRPPSERSTKPPEVLP